MVKIDRAIRQRHLTQAGAAQLVALGHDVEIVVKPVKRGSAELRVA